MNKRNSNQENTKLTERDRVKQERFTRLAEARVNNVLRSIRILGNLSNTSNYWYDDQQVQRIFDEVRDQLQVVEQKFRIGSRRKDERRQFKF
jgi:hypothetical protein